MKKILISFFILFSVTSTVPVYAALDYSGLVQCDGVVDETNPNEVSRNRVCNFAEFMNMANYIIRWLFMISVPIFIALCAYAGYLYMTGVPGNISQAQKMLWSALKGFVIMLIAWTLVSTLLTWLVDPKFKGADSLLEQKK